MNAADLREFTVPPRSLTIWWLCQGSFIVKSPGGTILAIDPYLSNSCKPLGDELGFNFDRMSPPPLAPADLTAVDCYVVTHSHRDHLDPETIAGYRAAGGRGPYLAPAETLEQLGALGVPESEMIETWANKTHTVGDIHLRTMFAIPSAGDDLNHVGYMVSLDGGPTVYFTGDTSYHDILALVARPYNPDVLVTVINGGFRNMSAAEAARLARELDVKVAIPSHYDLFPDNCESPRMFLTNLKNEGVGDIYCAISPGEAYTYPGT